PVDALRPWPAAIDRDVKLLAGLVALADRQADRLDAAARAGFEAARATAAAGSYRDDDAADDGRGNELEEIIGDSPALRVALKRVLEVAPTDASVVLVGETGTGKELFAREV